MTGERLSSSLALPQMGLVGVIVLVVLSFACQMSTPTPTAAPTATPTPTATPAPTPTPPGSLRLPDIAVSVEGSLESHDRAHWCVLPGESYAVWARISVTVRNIGAKDSGAFVVRFEDDRLQSYDETVSGLPVGGSTVVVFTTWRSNLRLIVDAENEVDESDESNNIVDFFFPIPTLVPPPTCTPTPSP